jgi:hypothetical protein
MVAARQPFLDAPPNWNDPANRLALAGAQTGVLVQGEYLRQHLAEAVPADVAGPVHDFIVAVIDMIAVDGQHQSAAVANDAAGRANAAKDKIQAACGLS